MKIRAIDITTPSQTNTTKRLNYSKNNTHCPFAILGLLIVALSSARLGTSHYPVTSSVIRQQQQGFPSIQITTTSQLQFTDYSGDHKATGKRTTTPITDQPQSIDPNTTPITRTSCSTHTDRFITAHPFTT